MGEFLKVRTENAVTLFRSSDDQELALVRDSGWRTFPPRLPHQPFFYPVLNEAYATQIARDWNTKDGGSGYVLRFHVDADFLARYSVQTVGAGIHQEYWIPAHDLEEFNRHLMGPIELIASFEPSHEQSRTADSS
jgi:hypothetical protein